MDFFEGVSFCREVGFGVSVSPLERFCSCLAGGIGSGLDMDCPATALDVDVLVFVFNFCFLGLAVTLFAGCPAGRLGSGPRGACLTVVGGILALKICDFSAAGVFLF
jgi:hypothetical protein